MSDATSAELRVDGGAADVVGRRDASGRFVVPCARCGELMAPERADLVVCQGCNIDESSLKPLLSPYPDDMKKFLSSQPWASIDGYTQPSTFSDTIEIVLRVQTDS